MRCSNAVRCWRKDEASCSSDASATLLSVSAAFAASRAWRRFSNSAVSAATCSCAGAFARFEFVQPSGERLAFLQAFPFLRGETFHLKHDRLNFLVQQPRWNFAAP